MLLQINDISIKYFGKQSDTVVQKGNFEMNKINGFFIIIFL